MRGKKYFFVDFARQGKNFKLAWNDFFLSGACGLFMFLPFCQVIWQEAKPFVCCQASKYVSTPPLYGSWSDLVIRGGRAIVLLFLRASATGSENERSPISSSFAKSGHKPTLCIGQSNSLLGKPQQPTSPHQSGMQGAKPLPGDRGWPPRSSLPLRSPPQEARYEWISDSNHC